MSQNVGSEISSLIPSSIYRSCLQTRTQRHLRKSIPHTPSKRMTSSPTSSLLSALWSSWAESEVTWDGKVPPLLTHSHKAFYCDGTLNPITSIWQDCYSDIKGNLTGTWWMPLQSINPWLQWKLRRGRPLLSLHGVFGDSELHLSGTGVLTLELVFLKPPGSQTEGDGWMAGAPVVVTPVCTAGNPYGSSGTTLLINTRSQTQWQHRC